MKQTTNEGFSVLNPNLITAVIGSVGAAGLLLLMKQRRAAASSWEPPQDWSAIELLWSESSPFAGGTNPPIGAISFFECPHDRERTVELWIQERVRMIAHANPWIAGRLVHRAGTRQLVYPSSPISDADLDRLVRINPADFAPTLAMSPEELSTEYQKVELDQVYDKSDALVSRFVTARTNSGGLAVLFIMSHVVGDGITFYSIFNQLSSSSKIKALSAKRKPQFEDPKVGVLQVLGRDMNKALLRPSSVISMLTGMLRGVSPRLLRRIVDDTAIAAAKAEAKRVGLVPYVSSNDILTSAFATKLGADVCIMAINLRGRIEGIDESDMGNYENGLLFDAACSATPSTVRKALRHPALQCRETPLPSLSAAFASKYCLISNWASGSVSLELPNCTESFHQPIFNVSSLQHSLPFDVAMIFRAAGRPGRLGVLWFTRTPGAEHELLAGLPLEL